MISHENNAEVILKEHLRAWENLKNLIHGNVNTFAQLHLCWIFSAKNKDA